MKIIVEKDYEKMSSKAASLISEAIQKKPDLILGLATGSTPIGTYEELIRMHKEEGLDFSKVTTFNLDEYYGLSPEDDQSYRYFMENTLFKHINIKKENTYVPDGLAKDPNAYGKEYDEKIQKQGGIDIQILGIGRNGHIAFNEPDDELILSTHLTGLTKDTINANSRFFDSIDKVPTKAITMGLGTIMKAKKIILLANGKNKTEIMGELLKQDKVTTNLPASLLLLHPDVTVIMDEEAAELYKKNL